MQIVTLLKIGVFSKCYFDSRNSIVSGNVLLFTEELILCDPYNKICRSSLLQWLDKLLSRFLEVFKEFCSFLRKEMATQEIVTGSFSFSIKTAQWVDCIPEIMEKFMFIQVTKISSQPVQIFYTNGVVYIKKWIFFGFPEN